MCMCIAFHLEACQTIAQETDVKVTARSYGDQSRVILDYTVPNKNSLKKKKKNLTHNIVGLTMKCSTVQKFCVYVRIL